MIRSMLIRAWTLFVAIIFGAALVSATAQAAPGLRAVWAVDDGEKVFQDDLDHALKSGGAGNSVWNGTTVSLFGARNEIIAFQVILEANSEGAQSVNVTVSDLVGSNGGVIAGSHPLPEPNDYVGVGVELFTEHYLNVAQYSYYDPGCGGFYTTAAANPQITGWIPDALIPFSAATGQGGAPFDVAADRNQGVWVDIYIPKLAPPGLYTGTVTVTVNSVTAAQLPIQLEALDLTLPDQNHYKSMVFYSRENIAARHDTGCCTQAMWDMILAYNRMAHRHRLELIGTGDWEEIDHIGGTITGAAFTSADGYEGPGAGIGNSLFSVHTYGWSFGDTEAEYRTNSDAWVSWFDANAPNAEYFLYLIDEPQSDMYDWIKQRADWIHNNPGPGHRLPVFITRWPITDLIGYIDIWSMQSPWYDSAVIAAARARGEKCWLYAGNRPQTPMDVTDEYGVALRLKPWIAYKSDIRRWFTWETTYWSPNSGEAVHNPGPKNVFVNSVTFDCGGPAGYGNGDGTMFYPGQDDVYPAQDRGYPGPMSSIRMKMYRRGAQDYEYMWLARHAGWEGQVMAILDGLLPHVMWGAVTVPDWPISNADYENARRQFADLALQPSHLRVLLEVHPNERAPGSSTGQVIGGNAWIRPAHVPGAMYWWKHHRFVGSDALWIQVCAQNWNAIQNGTGDDDNIRMRIDGFVPVDYDLIQNGPWGAYQWRGDKEHGHRWALRFLYLGLSPGTVLHALQFEADETPVIWWIKVTDLQQQMIYPEL